LTNFLNNNIFGTVDESLIRVFSSVTADTPDAN